MDKIVRRTLLSAGRPSMNCFRNFADVVPQSNNLVNTDRSDLNEQEMSHKESNNKSLSGFGKAFTKFSKLTNKSSLDEPDVKFATLLRHSKLIQVTYTVVQCSNDYHLILFYFNPVTSFLIHFKSVIPVRRSSRENC
jgi:hypothetical protein